MANRPVFIPDPTDRLVSEPTVEFQWQPGFATSQKQRNITALHQAATVQLGLTPILEVSTKSPHPLGARLSAFRLTLRDHETGHRILLEAAFQGSKVFSTTGQHPDIYSMRSGRDIKTLMRSFDSEQLVGFRFEGRSWELHPTTAFYDWLYLRAILDAVAERPQLLEEISNYPAYTDIEFNPGRSVNCQARSCALVVALSSFVELGELAALPGNFIQVVEAHHYGQPGLQQKLL